MLLIEYLELGGLTVVVTRRYDVVVDDRGFEFSSRGRAEAIDSASRNRGVTRLVAGRRVTEACVFGRQPHESSLSFAIGRPERGCGSAWAARQATSEPHAKHDEERQ
jgi:hypothetical protein